MDVNLKKISPYIQLLRLNYQSTFIEVLFGVLLVIQNSQASLSTLFPSFLGLFVSFVLFYGGLYTLNDIRDREEDRKNERKSTRPIPSGSVSVPAAVFFSFAILSLGIFSGYYLFGKAVLTVYLFFLVINISYTFLFKRIPFVELIVNSLTHPLRVVLGIVFIGGQIPYLFIFSYFWLTLGLASRIRKIMKLSKGSEHRSNIAFYTKSRMLFLEVVSFIALVCIAFVDHSVHAGWYILLILLYVFLVFDIPYFEKMRQVFKKVYTMR